jgi:hypothetical protein
MTDQATFSWLALVGLGAFHGINPGMGWLFAVALGMQEKSRAAVYKAMLPLALGHALAVLGAVALAVAAGFVVPLGTLRWVLAAFLLLMGTSRLFRHRHPRWSGMRVGMGGLTLWSFLMASAHGAGLMVVPLFLGMTMAAGQHDHHAHHAMSTASAPMAFLATGAHAAGYLVVTAAVAALIYEKFGVTLLRRAWFNLDRVWAAALVATGVLTLSL